MPDAGESPRLLAAINHLNRTLMPGRVFQEDGSVGLDWSMPATAFVPDEFIRMLLRVHHSVAVARTMLAEALVENA